MQLLLSSSQLRFSSVHQLRDGSLTVELYCFGVSHDTFFRGGYSFDRCCKTHEGAHIGQPVIPLGSLPDAITAVSNA